MGFSEIWTLYDKSTFDEKESVSLERYLVVSLPAAVGKDSVDVTPWLIVDMSNVTGCLAFMYGGHRAVFDHYLESYWRAIFSSGFKVKIIKDGKHDALRGITKLQRMLHNANSADLDSATGAMNMYFDADAIIDLVMQDCMAVWQHKVDCGECDRVPTVEILRAEEEADAAIRSFCRESVRKAPNVAMLILSNDASLILGLEGKIYLVSPSRLELRSRVEVPGPPLLFGATIPLPVIGAALGRLCRDTLLGLQSHSAQHQTLIEFLRTQPITSTVLLMVSCLLGGEHRNVDYDDLDSKPFGADSPFAVVMFLSNCLFSYEHPMRFRENRKQCNLVCATLAVMTFFCEMIGNNGYPTVTSTASLRKDQCFNTFGLFLKELKDMATSIINSSSRQNSFSPQRTATQPSIFRLLYSCNSGGFFKVCVAASAIHVDRMVQVLKNRLSESADLTSSREKVLYTGRWSAWLRNNFSSASDYSFNFQSALEPLDSFVSQVQLVLESHKKPTAPLQRQPADISLSGESILNNWVRATEAMRAEVGPPHLVWQGSVAAVCPTGYTTFREKNLYNLVRSCQKLPNKGFLIDDSSYSEGHGSQRGLQWTFVSPLQHAIVREISSTNPVAWNGNIMVDLDARAQYLTRLFATQEPAGLILEAMCHPNVLSAVGHIESFWSKSCGEWFHPVSPLTSSSASSSTVRMSALMCGAVLQSLILVFRDHPDLLDESALSRIVEACLLSPYFSQSVSAAVAVVRDEGSKSATTTNSTDKKVCGIAHVSAQLQAWQGQVIAAMQLKAPFLCSNYCIVEILAKVCNLLSGIAGKDRNAVWQLNRWLDLFGILAVLEFYQKGEQEAAAAAAAVAGGPDRDLTLRRKVLREVLGLGSQEVVSTTYLFVNGLSIQKSTTTNGLQIVENNIMDCKSRVLESLKIFA